jgi:hypothetical protein
LFKCFGSRDGKREHAVSSARQIGSALRQRLAFAIIRESRLHGTAGKVTNCRGVIVNFSSRPAWAAPFKVAAFKVVTAFKSYDNRLPAWHRQPEPEEAGETP